jgi:GDPmannose 4,6-dehydratase
MKTALICGVSGQDGAYLAKLLLEKGYRVVGTSRDATTASFANLHRLSIREHIECQSMTLNNFNNVIQVLSRIKPDEIYNVSGLSSVGLSFEQPIETMESIAIASINLMEAVRFLGAGSGGSIRLYNASSSECFGDIGDQAACEDTPFYPRSPYAVAKAAAHWATVNFREAYGLFASNGILFNHESPLRPDRFVTRKIISQACRISADRNLKLRLGNLDIVRDWGWAPQYVEAIWRILQIGTAGDFVIATGESHSLQEFVAAAFEELGLDWRAHVEHDTALMRPSDIARSKGDPSKAINVLGWKPSYGMRDVVRMMLRAELHSDGEAGPT